VGGFLYLTAAFMGLFLKTGVKQAKSLTGQGLQRFLMINTAILQIKPHGAIEFRGQYA
jgi:hypothetical protein